MKQKYIPGLTVLVLVIAFSIYAAQASSHLGAPKMISPKNGESLHYPIPFRWEPVTGAATYSYELESFYDKAWQPGAPVTVAETQTSLELNATDQKNGDRMRWRVWATDARGKDGKKSAWSEFTLLYTPPAGINVNETTGVTEEQEVEVSEFSEEELISEYKRISANEKTWQKELQKLQLEKFGKKLPKNWKKLKRKRVYHGIESTYYRMLSRFEKAKNFFKEKNYVDAHRLAKAAEDAYIEVPDRLAQIEEEARQEQDRIALKKERQETEAERKRTADAYNKKVAAARAKRQKHLKAVCGKNDIACVAAAAELCVPRKISLTWGGGIESTIEVKGGNGDLCTVYFRNDKAYYTNLEKGTSIEDLKAIEGLDGSCAFDQRVMWINEEPESAHVLADLKKEYETIPDKRFMEKGEYKGGQPYFDLMQFLHNLKTNYPSCEGSIFQ